MKSILSTLNRVWTDILAGRNLEAYIVTILGIALILLGIFGDVAANVQLTVIIAALTLLVFKTTTPSSQKVDLDSVLHDRDNFGPFRDVVRGSRKVWIYGPSSTNALREDLEREVLSKNGEVRVILQDPSSPAIEYLCDQLDTRDPRADLKRDLESSLKLLGYIASSYPTGKLEYRLLPYSPGFSMVIVDPDSSSGRVIVEFLGFRYQHIKQRMHIEISRNQSQHWFDHWVEQYQRLWDAARPPKS